MEKSLSQKAVQDIGELSLSNFNILWLLNRYYIAQTYDQIGDLENTIKYNQIILDIDPENESAIVNITYALMRAGRNEETIKYAQQVIEKSSDLKNITWTREVLEDLHADVSIADRKQKEVEYDIKNLFDTEQFAKIEKQLVEADRLKLVNKDGDLQIYSLYKKFIPSNTAQRWRFDGMLPQITKWIAQNPDSHFANASAGIFYLNYAWNARGTGFAGSITDKSSELFQERMKIAGNYLVKAYNLLPTDSSVPCNIISVARVSPEATDNKNIDEWYKLAVKAYQGDPAPHKIRFYYLAPEWGGSLELQFEFARSVVENSSKTSSAPQILYDVYWREYEKRNDRDYFTEPAIWEELSGVYSTLVKEFPDSMKFHNRYAKIAYFADNPEIARQEFEAIGENWDNTVWYLKEDFYEARNKFL